MTITYGLAQWERITDEVYTHPDEVLSTGIDDGNLADFLNEAGKHGWELCSSLPVANAGSKTTSPLSSSLREVRDGNEAFLLVFKKHG